MPHRNFRSQTDILEEDFYFHYVFTIIKLSKNMMETLYEEDIYRDHQLKIKKSREIKQYKDFSLIKTLEFIGAPPKYLEEHQYSEMNIEDYIAEIKQLRKIKKKNVVTKQSRKKRGTR